MRQARIMCKDREAGVLTQHDDGSFTFRYHDSWADNPENPDISLTMPKQRRQFHSKHLFPFFYSMLPEGSNKQAICRYDRIDEDDDFGLLMSAARYDAIGAVRVVKV